MSNVQHVVSNVMFQGSDLFTVQAIDGDVGVNNNISYSIIRRKQPWGLTMNGVEMVSRIEKARQWAFDLII